jgi:membrane protease YdiL (CAAX protease family)
MNPPTTPRSTLLRFFTLTYFLSWLIWIPLVLSRYNIGPFHVPEDLSSLIRLIGVLMPACTAIIITVTIHGRQGVRQLFSRFRIWRVDLRCWLAALLVYPAVLIASGILYNTLGGRPSIDLLPLSAPLVLINIIFLLLASLGEEIGWRGLALPTLLQATQPLQASALLGIVWATWHLPFWLLLDIPTQYGITGYFALNYLFIVPTTFYITWVFINTRHSLLIPVIYHVAFNIVNVAVFPVTNNPDAFALFVGLQLIIWVAVLILLRKHPSPTP